MEKGQCQTVANWEGGNIVRSRKATPTATTPGQTSLHQQTQQQQQQTTNNCTGFGPATTQTHSNGRRQSLLSVAWTDTDTGIEKILWREIDKMSRIIFPGLFLVFVVFYWPILLFKSTY